MKMLAVVHLLLALSVCVGALETPEIQTVENEEPSGSPQPQPEADADYIVVGTGPGGTGFVRRFAELQPSATILWFEKGLDDFLARNWPEDIADNLDVLLPVPREKLVWYQAYAWNSFGGGDATSSGGPNYLGMDRSGREQVYDDVDVVELREQSITPHTTTSRRWEQAFLNSGYSLQNPALTNRDTGANEVGQVSSIRTEQGNDRLRFADEIRKGQNAITYVHARIFKVLNDGAGRATGVTGIRLATDQSEVGEVTTWTARKAVILAGGVFNTFDLLVESGIGPEEYLQVRGVPKPWWSPNDMVGKGVGEEPLAVFATVEPEASDLDASEPRLAAQNSDDVSYTYWNAVAKEWFQFSGNLMNYLLGTLIPGILPTIAPLMDTFLGRLSFLAIGIPFEPVMSLKAVQKLANGTSGFDKNPLGVILDDSNLIMTKNMCQILENALQPIREYIQLQKQVRGFSLTRSLFDLVVGLGLADVLVPNIIEEQNIDSITNNGQDCGISLLASYYHFYGGTADVIDENYKVLGTTNLYISDASVFRRLAPGATSSIVMQEGMRVASSVNDAFPP